MNNLTRNDFTNTKQYISTMIFPLSENVDRITLKIKIF